jgi:hypothetical protein
MSKKSNTISGAVAKLAAALFLLAAVPAHAEIDATDYARVKDTKAFATYVNGLGKGFEWANTMSGNKLYCVPDKLRLQQENFLDILDQEMQLLTKSNGLKGTYVDPVLLMGLMTTFQCKR